RRHTRSKRDWSSDVCSSDLNGYAISFGEKTKGTVSVGAAVIGYGQKVHGAISAEFLEYDTTEEHIAFIIEHVKQAAQIISEQLRSEERRVGKEGRCGRASER